MHLMFCFTKKGFHVVHINIHYLYPKLDEIKLRLSNNNTFDCVCETFLDSTFCDSEISIIDNITFRKDRLTNGGGLVVYVKHRLNCVLRLDLESENIESIWLEFKCPSARPFY